jgi:hypothetical protein
MAAVHITRAEISGWDAEQQFFVERAELSAAGHGKNAAVLSNRVQRGSLVFVRPVDWSEQEKSHPVAYRVVEVRPKEGPAPFRVVLEPLHPKEK